MDIMPINLSLIPYTFEITLSGRVYKIAFRYNLLYDFFTVDLILNNVILVSQEKLVLGQFLFREAAEDKDHNVNSNFPNELLYVGSEDKTIDRVSITNLGDSVQIYIVDRSEVLENA